MQIDLDDSARHARRWQSKASYGPTRAKAVLDTGAEMSIIESSIAEALLLEPIRLSPLAGVGGPIGMTNVHSVVVVVGPPELRAAPIELTVMESAVLGAGVTCLLGRDLLRAGGLAWYGDTDTFQLVLPR